jgi:hypothetical protein
LPSWECSGWVCPGGGWANQMGPCKSKALFLGPETRTLTPLVSPVSYWEVSLFSTDMLLPSADAASLNRCVLGYAVPYGAPAAGVASVA